MPLRIRRRRPAGETASSARVPGVAALGILPAAADHAVVHGLGLPLFAALGYLASLVVLVVFGIWGFRLGSGRFDEGNGGGGSRGPDLGSPPPAGGRELTDDFAAWEEQLRAAGHKPAEASEPELAESPRG
jgi:hypothetical protein